MVKHTGDERWHAVDRLFTEALDLPVEARQAFLDDRCDGDPEVRDRVSALLEASDDDQYLTGPEYRNAVDRAVAEALGCSAVAHAVEDPLVGTVLGAYRIVRPIGRGGMGNVYLAERAQGFEQTVAIKTLRRGIDTDDVVQRFLAERSILAQLQHPNIARLYDGGVTADGRPYFVMEFVAGRTVTDHADQQGLGVQERVRLLRTVGAALHYAHRHLIIHRDLKPSNVLVSERGTVKLLDFGIARLLGVDSDRGSPRTATSSRVFTPAYAAPEQIARAPVTTATDVYQLGVLAYELLAGVRPFPSDLGGPELEHLIMEVEPEPISKAVRRAPESAARSRGLKGQRAHAQALAGDLETVVAKALAKESTQRYLSVEAMSADLGRYLDGRPITARRATLVYRFSRFRRRNRWFLPTAFTAAAAGALYLANSIQHDRELAAERLVAVTEAERAEAVTAFVTDLIGTPNPWAGGQRPDVTLLEALGDGPERIEREFAGQPILQARLFQTLGGTYFGLERFSDAEASQAKAVQLWSETEGDTSANALSARRAYGRTLAVTKGADSAIGVLGPLLEQVADPVTDEQHLLRSQILESLAWVEWQRSDFDAAFDFYNRALASLQRASSPMPIRAAAILRQHARALFNADRQEQSIQLGTRAVTMLEAALPEDHLELAAARRDLANTLSFPGSSVEEALPEFDRILEVFERRFEPGHPSILSVRYDRAYALMNLGRLREAEAEYRALVDAYPASGPAGRHHAASLQNLAVALERQGRHDEALDYSVRAHDVYERVLGLHYETAYPLLTAAEIALTDRRFGEARELASEAYDILTQTLPDGHSAIWVARCRRGQARWATGMRSDGLADMELASAALDVSSYGPDHAHPTECRDALHRARSTEG